MLNLSIWDHWCHLDEVCCRKNSTRKWQNDRHCCHGSHSGVRGGMSRKGIVKSDGGIQSVLAVFLPSAQTFINITSLPSEKPTSNLDKQTEIMINYKSNISTDQCVSQCFQPYCTYMEGLLAPARNWKVGLGVVVRSCVHVNVHLHLVVQDLHKLLHGGQVTWLQFWPHWHIYGKRTLASK